MKVIRQGTVFCSVVLEPDRSLRVLAVRQSALLEASVSLLLDAATFSVVECEWEISRSPDAREPGAGEIPDMRGVEMLSKGGGAVRSLEDVPEAIRELLRECIRGLVQAEIYVLEERGFPDRDAYDRWCLEMFAGGCRYHSGSERDSGQEFVGSRMRGKSLFNRYKNVVFSGGRDSETRLCGRFRDNFHEINIDLSLSQGTIGRVETTFTRARGPACYEMEALSEVLCGERIATLDKKRIGELLGGREGCSHLVDLLSDMAREAQSAMNG